MRVSESAGHCSTDARVSIYREFARSKDTLHPLMRWNVPFSAERHPEGVPNTWVTVAATALLTLAPGVTPDALANNL